MNLTNKVCTAVLFGLLLLVPTVTFAQAPNYQQNVNATANWIVNSSSLPDGAILYTNTQINPYYGNLAAMGLVQKSANHPQIEAWMRWYLSHFNYPSDRWGLACTIYDFNVSGTTETPTNNADSTDSYAATFLSLAWAYWKTGDPNAQAYIQTLKYELDCIGGVIVQTKQPWVIVSGAAALRGDFNSMNRYINKIQTTYVAPGFPWPWYCQEGGWFIRVNNYMLGRRPL